MWIDPITNRTGTVSYNLEEDINRVENNIGYLATVLNASGYSVAVDVKAWEYGDKFQESDGERILQNLEALKSSFYSRTDTPTVETMQNLTTTAANEIEEIQADLKLLYDNMLKSFSYTGATYSGV